MTAVLVVVVIRVAIEGKYTRLAPFTVGLALIGITAGLAAFENSTVSAERIGMYLGMAACAAYFHYKAMFWPLWRINGKQHEGDVDNEPGAFLLFIIRIFFARK